MQNEMSGIIFSIGRLSISYNFACIALPCMIGTDILEDENTGNKIEILAVGIFFIQFVLEIS